MPSARRFGDIQYHGPEKTTVTLSDADPATGSAAVVFDVAYKAAPVVMVVPPKGASGTWQATGVTKSGFTIEVSEENDDWKNQSVEVVWFACEET